MDEQEAKYIEPEKNLIRHEVLSHAVKSLTTGRDRSALLSVKEFRQRLNYVLDLLDKHGHPELKRGMSSVTESWLEFRQTTVGRKRASELKVLILCGPNPENDMLELVKLGVSPHNIWAVENNRADFEAALTQMRKVGFPAKIYKCQLSEFFASVPQKFDIVYFDACGPLLGGQSTTWNPLKELFMSQRLEPLSALITNFSAPPSKPGNSEPWARQLASWFAPSSNQPVKFADGKSNCFSDFETDGGYAEYLEHVRNSFHLLQYYSEFLTSFIPRFASTLLPWWRVSALKFASQQMLASQDARNSALAAALNDKNFDANIQPVRYPYIQIAKSAKDKLQNGDLLRQLFHADEIGGVKLASAVVTMSILRNFQEDRAVSEKLCGSEFAEVVREFIWFDSDNNTFDGLFLERPLSGMLVDLCIGQLGYPYHSNAHRQKRFTYIAKTNPMFTDVFIFDQARYLYDLVPHFGLLHDELPDSLQIFLRICMESIRRHANTEYDPFSSAMLGGEKADAYEFHAVKRRIALKPDIEKILSKFVLQL